MSANLQSPIPNTQSYTMNLLFLVHTASTLCLVGLIWTIQLVHYPLFEQVGSDTYTAYQAAHQWRITLLVLPLMLAELVTAGLLVLNPPRDVPAVVAWLGLILVGVIWLSTFFLQMPQHATLGKALMRKPIICSSTATGFAPSLGVCAG